MSSKKSAPQNNGESEKPSCFVLMPISDPDGYEKGHFRRVYEDIFMPACDKAGFKAVRADEVHETNLIHLDILQKLIDSPMAVCDLSGRNANALFELGLRQAFDKPVVLVQETGTPQIFDIAPLRYVEYKAQLLYREVLEDQEKIATAIRSTEKACRTGQGVNSIVRLLSLTHPATLQKIADEDKQSGLLQVIMSELSSVRSDLKSIASRQTNLVEEPRSDVMPRARVVKELQQLARGIRALSDETNKLREHVPTDGDTPNSEHILEDLEILAARGQELQAILRYTGAIDEDAEALALLLARIKTVKGRYLKYKDDVSASPA